MVTYRILETDYCTELINVDSQYSDATKLHDFLYAGCLPYFTKTIQYNTAFTCTVFDTSHH